MPRGAKKPLHLARADARRIWLHAQRLDTAAPFGAGPAATPAAIEHLGYVQIDTINVIERCHHHILCHRIPAYRRADLAPGPERRQDRCSNTGRMRCPMCRAAISASSCRDEAHREHRRAAGSNRSRPADLRKVARRVLREGPLSIRDIDDDVLVEKDHAWASRKPSKRALQLAFFTGALTMSRARRHAEDLRADRPAFRLGQAARARRPSGRSLTICSTGRCAPRASSASIRSAISSASRKPAIRQLIERRVRGRHLVPVAIEGAGKTEHWARPEALDAIPGPVTPSWSISSRPSTRWSSSASG